MSYTVRVGSPWIDQVTRTTSDVPVLQVILNPSYQPQRYWSWVGQANDIGLLKLQHELNFSNYVWPICLPDLNFQVEEGCRCTVMGWGLSKAKGESQPLRPGCRPGRSGVDVSGTPSPRGLLPRVLSCWVSKGPGKAHSIAI